MAKNENKNDKKAEEKPEDKNPAAEKPVEGIKVKMLLTAQGPNLRLMAGHVHVLPKAQAESYIAAGAAEKFVEKANDKKAEARETR